MRQKKNMSCDKMTKSIHLLGISACRATLFECLQHIYLGLRRLTTDKTWLTRADPIPRRNIHPWPVVWLYFTCCLRRCIKSRSLDVICVDNLQHTTDIASCESKNRTNLKLRLDDAIFSATILLKLVVSHLTALTFGQ